MKTQNKGPVGVLFIALIRLAALEGIAGGLALFLIPSDSKNAFLWRYSAARWALITAMLLGVGLLVYLLRSPGYHARIIQTLQIVLGIPVLSALLIGGLGLLILATMISLLAAFSLTDVSIQAQLIRLAPFSTWLFLCAIQFALLIAYIRKGPWSGREIGLYLLKLFACSLIALEVFIPRYRAIDRFATADEEKWAMRAANFYIGLKSQNYRRTFQAGHPGVGTMWAGALGILATYPDLPDSVPQINEVFEYSALLEKRGMEIFDMIVAGRCVLVGFHVAFLLLAFHFLRKRIGFLPAFVGIQLLIFDPFHLAHSRLLHLDGLLSSSIFAAVMGFDAVMEDGRKMDIFLTGLAVGAACLTKSTGLFLLPAFGFFWLFFHQQETGKWLVFWRQKGLSRKLLPFLSVVGIGCLTYFFFWPALWVSPGTTIGGVIGEALGYASAGHESPVFFNGQIFPDGRIGFFSWFYPLTYLWRTTPWIMVGLFGAGLGILFHIKPFDRPSIRRLAVGILVFAITFGLVLNMGEKKFDRYLLPIFLPLDLLGVFGLSSLCQVLYMLWRRLVGEDRNSQAWLFQAFGLLLFGVGQGAYALNTAPYYLSYYNPAIGGPEAAEKTMMIGWGEGLDQAARYLNEIQQQHPIVVFSWYNSAFNHFFDGEAREIRGNFSNPEEETRLILDADYAVIYIHQWQRNIPEPLLDALRFVEPVYVVQINGIEYAEVYDLKAAR